MTHFHSSGRGHSGTTTLAERLHALRQELDDAGRRAAPVPLEAAERERLKQQIIVLFREADAAVQQALSWKEAAKALVEQWKQIDGRRADTAAPSATSAATPTGTSAVTSARVDHLGASTFVEKGWSRWSLLDLPGAEQAFRRALELAPGHIEAETLLAWTEALLDRHDDARRRLQAVLQREPHHALAHTVLGFIGLRRQAYADAIEPLSAVIRADTDRRAVLYAHLYLGMVYRERDMVDDAEAFFRKALELGPNLLQAWYELGRTYWFAGRRGDACLAWKTGSEANKFSPWGKRCAEMLQVMELGGTPPRDG